MALFPNSSNAGCQNCCSTCKIAWSGSQILPEAALLSHTEKTRCTNNIYQLDLIESVSLDREEKN